MTDAQTLQTVNVQEHGSWLELRLNRPERLNAFTDEMHRNLRAHLERAASDPNCRAVLLTGEGRGFCAGQDLGDRDPRSMDGPPDLEHTLSTFYNPLVQCIRGMGKPVVCAVNGVAAGAGANIALSCDLVLAAKSAKFIQSFAKVGLVPDAGGSWLLPRLLGEARAKAWAMTAEPISAETAHNWGLVWKVFEDDELLAAARAQTQALADAPTFGLGLTKQAMQAAAGHDLNSHLTLEAQLQGRAGRSQDYREGVTAFLDKRAPTFSGQE